MRWGRVRMRLASTIGLLARWGAARRDRRIRFLVYRGIDLPSSPTLAPRVPHIKDRLQTFSFLRILLWSAFAYAHHVRKHHHFPHPMVGVA